MIEERRSIRGDEVEVIRATLDRAEVRAVTPTAADSIDRLIVVGRCELWMPGQQFRSSAA